MAKKRIKLFKKKAPKTAKSSKKKKQKQAKSSKPAQAKPAAPRPIAKPTAAATQKQLQQPQGVQSLGNGPVRLFPTICYVQGLPSPEKMNKELERIILASEVKGQDLQRSAIKGGYRSDRTFLDMDNWAVKDLKKLITDHALKYLRAYWKSESSVPLEKIKDFRMKLSGWSVLLRDGNAGAPHIHPRANISGVYYVSTPPMKPQYRGAGNIVLADPRIRASVAPVRDQISSIMVPPTPGLLLMFPGYIEHYILPFKGDGTRISVAFNLTFSPSALSQGY